MEFSVCFRRWIQQVSDRILRALWNQSWLFFSHQLSSCISSWAGRAEDKLRLLRWGVWPGTKQCHRIWREPNPKQPACLPCPDSPLLVSGLCQRFQQPGCLGKVWHQVHPERNSQPSQHVWARWRIQVQADSHLRSLESESLPILSWGHCFHW